LNHTQGGTIGCERPFSELPTHRTSHGLGRTAEIDPNLPSGIIPIGDGELKTIVAERPADAVGVQQVCGRGKAPRVSGARRKVYKARKSGFIERAS
jgi:hypothetical protein